MQKITPTPAQNAGIYFPDATAVSQHGLTNVWTGPQQDTGAQATAKGMTGPRPVVTATKIFADGQSRSIVALYRDNFALPSKWPSNGWRPVNIKPSGSNATWSPYTDVSALTSANYDRLMNMGYVLFLLDGDLGNAGAASGRDWPSGWWAHPAKGVWPADLANFQWGVSKLTGKVVQGAGASGVVVPSSPMPVPVVQPVIAVAPRFSMFEKVAAVAVVGAVLYEVVG